MLIKYYELKNVTFNKYPFILLHGNNRGLKNQTLQSYLGQRKINFYYEEQEILNNSDSFFDSLFSQSLFESEKIILIKRCSEKIFKVLSEIINKEIKDIKIILDSKLLEKKSKLRSFFEKEKKAICVAFYPDDKQTLSRMAYDYLKENNVSISSSDLNIIIDNINGDREQLFQELEKLQLYCKYGKKINTRIVTKLSNVIENHNISDLIDNCLAKNKKKTITILNENIYNNDDCILILRICLNKLKKILNLAIVFEKNKNIELTISSAKPPIFWKEKDILKKQLLIWTPKIISKKIFELSSLEVVVKKNYDSSINLVRDFIFNLATKETNN